MLLYKPKADWVVVVTFAKFNLYFLAVFMTWCELVRQSRQQPQKEQRNGVEKLRQIR